MPNRRRLREVIVTLYFCLMLAKQHIQKWAEEGFLFIRSADRRVRRVSFESIDHSKHMATQTGYQAFIQRRDGKNFGIVFTNSVTVNCRFNAPTALIPNGDPEQAWWVFPPTHQDDGRRIVAFSKSRQEI